MKPKYLLFLLFLLEGCMHKDKKPTFLSFQNKWGVLCYFDQIHNEPQRTIFLPLENRADSTSITGASSIFDFKYGLGMDYYDRGNGGTNYKIYWMSDHQKILSERDHSYLKIFWVFAKLKYHAVTMINEPLTGQIFHLILINKNNQLPVETFYFNKSVAIDTAYFKKKFIMPTIDTAKSKLKIVKPRSGLYL